jgi:hypothetical protein
MSWSEEHAAEATALAESNGGTLVCGKPFTLPPLLNRVYCKPPADAECLWCAEPLTYREQGLAVRCIRAAEPDEQVPEPDGGMVRFWGWYHRWCYLRAGVGSTAHQVALAAGDHDCAAHADAEDREPGTRREQAVAAARHFYGGTLPA